MTSLRIVAAGSGHSMSFPKVVDAVLALAMQPSTVKIVYLGTATNDNDEPYLAQTDGYRQLPQCEVIKLDVSEAVENIPSMEEIEKILESAHVVMVSEGNPLYAMHRWRALGIDKILRRISTSAVLCGGGTGAVVWFEYGHSHSMDPTTLHDDSHHTEAQNKDWKVDGLGLLPLLCVPCHDATQSSGLPRSLDSDSMMLEDPEQLCLGIEENAALVIEKDTARVISGDGIAQCYLKWCIRTKSGYDVFAHAIEAPIPLEHLMKGDIPWKDYNV